MSAREMSPAQLREWLARTEARLNEARARLSVEQAKLNGMARHERRRPEGAKLAAYVEQLYGAVESLDGVMAGARYELGLDPEPPTACPHTYPGHDGTRLPCERTYGHGGLHEHRGVIRRRWE